MYTLTGKYHYSNKRKADKDEWGLKETCQSHVFCIGHAVVQSDDEGYDYGEEDFFLNS